MVAGEIVELGFLHPRFVTVLKTKRAEVAYRYNDGSNPELRPTYRERLRTSGSCHLTASPACLRSGITPRRSGLAIAQREAAATFFRHASQPSGALELPEELSQEAYNRLKSDFEQRRQGLANIWRPMILEGGSKWSQIGVPPGDAQLIEQRRFSLYEVCRIFGVQPHLIMELERSTNNNIEQQALEAEKFLFRPLAVRLEQSFDLWFLTPTERRSGLYFKHNLDALLRADIKTRYEAYGQMFDRG